MRTVSYTSRYMHACIIDCIVATPPATNEIISSWPCCCFQSASFSWRLFMLLPILSEFRTLSICFSYLWSLQLSYLVALLIDHVTSLTGYLSLSISPDCCYAFILEFLLSCLLTMWLFFLSRVSPCLAHSTSLGIVPPHARACSGSVLSMCNADMM